MGDGRLDPKDAAILQGIADWWKVNGESIRGCGRTPLAVQTWGESTRKGSTLYLHVFEWPKGGRLVVGGLQADTKTARLLEGKPDLPLAIQRPNPLDVVIQGLPASAPDTADSVIALEIAGEIKPDAARLLQPDFARDTLRVFDAELHGQGLKFGAGKTRDAYVTGWSSKDAFIAWPARLESAARFVVEVIYDAEPASAGGRFAVSFGADKLTGEVKAGTMQSAALGQVTLKPGNLEIKLAPVNIAGAELMRPRSLILKSIPSATPP
jgi:hypothetical protein